MQELDRILDRDDVIRASAVDLVDHRGERRRLTGAGRTGDEDEAARKLRQVVQTVGQAELLERLQLVGDDTEDGGERVSLQEDVDTEAREAGDPVGEVELAVELEPLLLLRREDAIDERANRLRVERLEVGERAQLSTHARRRGCPDRHVEVGSAAGDRRLEQRVD